MVAAAALQTKTLPVTDEFQLQPLPLEIQSFLTYAYTSKLTPSFKFVGYNYGIGMLRKCSKSPWDYIISMSSWGVLKGVG